MIEKLIRLVRQALNKRKAIENFDEKNENSVEILSPFPFHSLLKKRVHLDQKMNVRQDQPMGLKWKLLRFSGVQQS